MTTDEKIVLASKKAQEVLVVMGHSDTLISKQTPVDNLLDLLDCTLVFAKYDQFDLEATRREREFFRNQNSNQE